MTQTVGGVTYQTTEFATGHAGVNKLISKNIWTERGIDSFFKGNGFVGKEGDDNAIVIDKMDLQKEKGDKITILLTNRLTGAGVTGDSVLKGSEEVMTHPDTSVTLTQYRHATVSHGRLSEQRFIGNIREIMQRALRKWLDEKEDGIIFTVAATSLTRVAYAGAATATDELSAVDTMSLAAISKAKTIAKLARLEPLTIGGKEWFVLVISLYQAFDLRMDVGEGSWRELQLGAQKRSDTHPLFRGALGEWDQVIIFEHESIPTSTAWGAGADLPGSTALLFGVNAILRGYGGYPETGAPVSADSETDDYGNIKGYAIAVLQGTAKTVFSTEDHAVVGVRTAHTLVTEGV